MAWCPGGRTRQNADEATPASRAATASRPAPAARRAAGHEAGPAAVSLSIHPPPLSQNRASASALEVPRSRAMSLVCMREKLKPLPMILAKNAGGVIMALAVMWATTSRTDQPPHSDGLSHCSGVRVERSSASAARSR